MSIRVYPVQSTEEVTELYTLKINGEEIPLNTARVSAVPFNRRWPGHQRPKNQSRLTNFASFIMEGEAEFEITPKRVFENVSIRPASLGIKPILTENGSIKFSLSHPAYFTVEPYGREDALHIFADPKSEYGDLGEDVIYFGAGLHDVGMLNLKSNQTVFIDEGAVVYACIHAENCENIKIIGRGILDNSKNTEKILFNVEDSSNEADVGNAERLHTVQLNYCTNIQIEGITVRDSLVYNIRPIGCKNLDIKNVKIIGCWRYNSDGIDMHNCENVHISNCFIRTFDDSICVKGFDFYQNEADMYRFGRSYDVFKNVLIENCTIWNDWGKCLEIGAETIAKEICNITFRNCDIIHVNGHALDCMNVDYADVYDVCYENINVEYDDVIPFPVIQNSDGEEYENKMPDYSPYFINAEIVFHPEYSAGGTKRGKIHNLTFKNIRLFGKHAPKIVFSGYDSEHTVNNITLQDIYWNSEKLPEDYKLITNGFCEDIKIK